MLRGECYYILSKTCSCVQCITRVPSDMDLDSCGKFSLQIKPFKATHLGRHVAVLETVIDIRQHSVQDICIILLSPLGYAILFTLDSGKGNNNALWEPVLSSTCVVQNEEQNVVLHNTSRTSVYQWNQEIKLPDLTPRLQEKKMFVHHVGTFNNVALPVLWLHPEVGCCVAFLLLSTQLKPFPRRALCNRVWIRKHRRLRQSAETYPKGRHCLENKRWKVTEYHNALEIAPKRLDCK